LVRVAIAWPPSDSMTAHPSYPTMQLPSDEGGGLIPKLIVMAGAALLAMMVSSGASPLIATFILLLFMLPVVVLDPKTAICATFIFLPIMGDLRRLLIQEAVGSNDPVLLVGPLMAIALAGLAYSQGRLNRQSRLSKAVLVLMGIMVLQIFNPLQGGLAVGIGGALFYLVPVLWFWIGQSWGSAEFLQKVLLRVVVPVAILAGLMGVRQAFIGLYPYQHEWALRAYGPLMKMGSNTRPFSFFTSTAEYTQYLSIAIVINIAFFFAGQLKLVLLAVPFLFFAIFVSGVRGPVVGTLGTIVVLWSMLSRNVATRAVRLVAATAIAIAGLTWTLTQVEEMDLSSQAGVLVSHQTKGLKDPGNSEHSTAGVHGNLITGGFSAGLANPFGRGLGSTTLAGMKFSTGGASTEIDFSDTFIALGLVGGIVYLLFIYHAIRNILRLWERNRSAASLCVAAILVVSFGRWLLGAAYAVSTLAWLTLGALDRLTTTTKNAFEKPTLAGRNDGVPSAGHY
jgi:hypothetical protein